MTGDEMRDIRQRLKLNVVEFGAEIGYSGTKQSISGTIRRYESNNRPIPPWIATTARAMDADTIGDEIYKEVGDLLTFETIGQIADRIVDSLVRESDMVPDHGGDSRSGEQQGRRQSWKAHGEARRSSAQGNSD